MTFKWIIIFEIKKKILVLVKKCFELCLAQVIGWFYMALEQYKIIILLVAIVLIIHQAFPAAPVYQDH